MYIYTHTFNEAGSAGHQIRACTICTPLWGSFGAMAIKRKVGDRKFLMSSTYLQNFRFVIDQIMLIPWSKTFYFNNFLRNRFKSDCKSNLNWCKINGIRWHLGKIHILWIRWMIRGSAYLVCNEGVHNKAFSTFNLLNMKKKLKLRVLNEIELHY